MIKLVNVSKFYSSNNVIALGLRKVNMELHRNEFVAIVGESGSGKTTLLNVISGIDSYEDGEMYINGHETSYFSVSDMENYRKKYVAFVFQNYNLIDSYTVLQNVEAPLILSGYPKEKIRDRAKEIIRRVGLSDHMNHKATKLSGGQKQRVVIARALAKDCPIIAADEPTGNLDSKSAKQIIELLYEISKEKLVIMVTHDFSQVEDYATRKIRIFDGEIVEDLSLKKVEKLDLPTIPDEEHQIRIRDYLQVALRNLLAVPKKTLLMIIVFTFFSFFVAMAYGAYQIVMNETTSNYNTQFENINPNRIVLRKTDNTEFTQEDLSELADYNIVDQVVTFDYILDMSLYLMDNHGDVYIGGSFLPAELLDESDLAYGTMPETEFEIIYTGNEYEIDYYSELLPMTMYVSSGLESQPYTVVGLAYDSSLILPSEIINDNYILMNEDGLNRMKQLKYFAFIDSLTVMEISTEDIIDYATSLGIVIDETLDDNQIRIDGSSWEKCDQEICTYDTDIVIEDYYITRTFEDVEIVIDTSYFTYRHVFYMNQNTLDDLVYEDIYQVSLLTDTEIGVTSLVNTLQRLRDGGLLPKYKVIYPFDSEPLEEFEALLLLMMNIGMIALNVVTLLGSTLITYVIFRAIINTKLNDYAIYRTIGANKNTIKTFIYMENLMIVVVSYAAFLAINLSISKYLSTDTIFYALKVFNLWSYIIFFGLLILMSLIISRRYTNRIFRETVQTTLKTGME